MDLCLAAKRRPGPRVTMRWWKQEGLDFEGMWKLAWKTERTEEEEEKDGTETAAEN